VSWVEQAKQEIESRQPSARSLVTGPERSGLFDRLKSPPILAAVLAGLLMVAVAVLYFVSRPSSSVEDLAFSSTGLKTVIIPAPEPDSPQAKEEAVKHYGSGNRMAYQGKFEDAVAEYQQAVRLDPAFPHPHRAMGSMYAALGKAPLAAAAYETYLKLSPNGPDASQIKQMIVAYRQGGRPEQRPSAPQP
jgi:tetratricopeptide (TPR) repeat protein